MNKKIFVIFIYQINHILNKKKYFLLKSLMKEYTLINYLKKYIYLLITFLIIGCIRDSSSPKLIDEDEIKRSYTKTIIINSENAFTDSLISEAEKKYPARDSVLNVVDPREIELIPDSAYWFYSHFDGVLLPYAITKDAIKYYEDLIDSLRAGNIYQFIITAEFEYNSTITFKDTFILKNYIIRYYC